MNRGIEVVAVRTVEHVPRTEGAGVGRHTERGRAETVPVVVGVHRRLDRVIRAAIAVVIEAIADLDGIG